MASSFLSVFLPYNSQQSRFFEGFESFYIPISAKYKIDWLIVFRIHVSLKVLSILFFPQVCACSCKGFMSIIFFFLFTWSRFTDWRKLNRGCNPSRQTYAIVKCSLLLLLKN